MPNSRVDWSNPEIKDYLSLVRLQVLTPLSLLINVATVVICSLIVSPSIAEISRRFPTTVSPRPVVIAIYVIAVFATQLGYCVLLVIARKEETKRTFTSGVGMILMLSNWLMAAWAICWVLQWFTAATVFQGLMLVGLVYANIVLLIYHAPTTERPLDIALIHAPIRFFLVLQLSLMFPLTLFVTLGHTFDKSLNAWPGFGVVFGTNVLGLLVVIFRRDFVWALAATWINISLVLFKPQHTPAVYTTSIVFTALQPLALIASILYATFAKGREGEIELPGDEHPALHHDEHRAPSRQSPPAPSAQTNGQNQQGPREIEEGAVWS